MWIWRVSESPEGLATLDNSVKRAPTCCCCYFCPSPKQTVEKISKLKKHSPSLISQYEAVLIRSLIECTLSAILHTRQPATHSECKWVKQISHISKSRMNRKKSMKIRNQVRKNDALICRNILINTEGMRCGCKRKHFSIKGK